MPRPLQSWSSSPCSPWLRESSMTICWARTSTRDRFWPSGPSQVRVCSRPSTYTFRPLARYWLHVPASLSQATTENHSVSSSARWPVSSTRPGRFTATVKLQTGVPRCVYRSSGSRPRLPMIITLFSEPAIATLRTKGPTLSTDVLIPARPLVKPRHAGRGHGVGQDAVDRLVARLRVVVGRAAPHHRDLDGDPALVARVVEQPQPPGPVDLALARVAELQIAWVASPHVADVGVHRVGPEDLRDAAQIVAEGERVADVDVDLERWKPDRGEQLERVAWPLRGGAPMRLERHRHPLLASVLGDDVGVAPHLGPDLLPVPVGRGGPRADRDERGAEPRGDVDGPPETAQPLLLLGDARRDESEQSAHCRRDQPVPVVERQDLVDAAVVERVDRGRVVVARRELGAPVADRGDVRQRLLDRQLAVAVRPTAEPHRGLRHYTERQEETMAATVAVIGPLFDDLKQLEARGVRAIQAQGGSEQNIVESCADADVIMCFGLSPFTDRVFASLPKLKLVQQCTVGYDWIDVDAATRHGVAVANSPFFCTEEVSDHAVMHIMACARKLSQQLWAAREHGWNRQAAVEQMGEIFRLRGR